MSSGITIIARQRRGSFLSCEGSSTFQPGQGQAPDRDETSLGRSGLHMGNNESITLSWWHQELLCCGASLFGVDRSTGELPSPVFDRPVQGRFQVQFLGLAERRFLSRPVISKRVDVEFRRAWPKATAQRREAGFTELDVNATLGQGGRQQAPTPDSEEPLFSALLSNF